MPVCWAPVSQHPNCTRDQWVQLASTATAPDPAQGWYIDGLSFLPADMNDIRASKIDAFICDISAIEQVEQADGTVNYRRTYRACMESIRLLAPEWPRTRICSGWPWPALMYASREKKTHKLQCFSRFRVRIALKRVSQVDEFYLEDCGYFS
ncbi:MAG: hypothetical protein CM15mP74_14570 [Halieaceae bacterium]|nr:MAG: hypothetical protein CM15mP74_14570 [Halieaceae bacterium]